MSSINKLIKAFETNIHHSTPVEWAEKNRVLTPDITSKPGPVSFNITPYLIKPTNFFMPDRKAEISVMMKGSQLGISSLCIYSQMGWVMAESPANMLFITEHDGKIKDQMQGPIDQMINSSGLADVVGNHNIREREAKGRRKKASGDTLKGISYNGGHLYTLSGQTIGSLSSWAIKYGIYDEVERWKGNYKNAGDFVDLVEPRHRSYGKMRKLSFASTPEIKQTSNILPLYLLGDQQKYMIPCKCCGEMIELIWHNNADGNNSGIHYDRDKNGKFIEGSAVYICQECGGNFTEVHKYDMYEQAYNDYKKGNEPVCDWKATAEPDSPIYESYHISTLYSPVGFYSWQDLARKWCLIHPITGGIKKSKLQTFYNQELGLTWEETGTKIKSSQLLKNSRNYEINTVPDELSIQDGNGKIVLLTVAADLNGEIDDARLDYEVLAWSESGSSYSIDHGSIGTFQRSTSMRSGKAKKNEVEEAQRIKWTYRQEYANNVWSEFEAVIMSKTYLSISGRKFRPPIYGIDVGHFTVYAQAFVNKHPTCYALKGKSHNKYTRFDQIKSTFTKSAKVPGLFLVEGDIIKDIVSEQITLQWNEDMGIDQPAGFMNYPIPSGEKYTYQGYFLEYEGEERQLEINDDATAIGSRWTKKHSSSRNHYWDDRIYNYVCRDIIVEIFCKAQKLPVSWENFAGMFK